jgi:hypothetical protein
MNTTMNRNIILDLLPAYVGGDASAETRQLVEEYAKGDPEIARLIQAGGLEKLAGRGIVDKETAEFKTLKRVKRRVNKQAWQLGLAIFFSFFAVTFQIGEDGILWTWNELPWVAVLSGIIGLFFWVAYIESRKRIRSLL